MEQFSDWGPIIVLIGLLLTMFLTHLFYVKSVQPARMAKTIGDRAYGRAKVYRYIASVAMFAHVAAMVGYLRYPLPLGLPLTFGWGWTVSVIIGVLMAVPLSYLMYRGAKDAGRETMAPDKSHTLYRGIYERIRHPQAVGEAPLWIVIALLLNSPFLVLFSLLWIPLVVSWCYAEERDLVIRYGEPYLEYRNRVGMFLPRK